MEKRRIGSLEVTVVGVGCNNFGSRLDAEGTAAVVDAALEAGINFFDTADIYGGTKSEEFLGRALGQRRNDAIIATKFGMKVDEQRQGARPEYVRQACDASLRRLGVDVIDLYYQHRVDPAVPIEDTIGAMSRLVEDEAEILSVAVAGRHLGRGLARQLLQLHLRRLAGLGAHAVFLEVDEHNDPARRLYHRAGFREVSRRPSYYHAGGGKAADALVFRRDLL